MPQPKYEPEDYFWSIISSRLYVRGKRIQGFNWGNQGYRGYSYMGERYAAHRLIWFLVTGEWPKADIDHIDRVRNNNGFHNLREADDSTNPQNKKIYRTNKLGVRGVKMTIYGTYLARIMKDGKSIRIGVFKTLEEATEARKAAEKKYFTHATEN